jgi:hypothetical protein
VEWIGEVPEHWTISRIDHIATTHRENISPENFIGAKVFHYSIPVVQERGTGAVEDSSTVDSNKLVCTCTLKPYIFTMLLYFLSCLQIVAQI